MRPIDTARASRGIPPAERFRRLYVVDAVTGCWVWQGSPDTHGYGRIYVDGRFVQAHRFALVLAGVELVAGREVVPRCRNRLCVNAEHLEQVTRSESQARRSGSGPLK